MTERSDPLDLRWRFVEHLQKRPWFEPGEPVVVAVSGGLDSVVLLHLLRFGLPSVRLTVAHFDHRMRVDSGADRRWVQGLARTWGLECLTGSASEPLTSESSARRARYEFLEGVRLKTGARWVLTAHHADDQAETVLQRALRGTGPDGLAGILETREPGVGRPLLPFHRPELEAYATAARLAHRVDPTNADTRITRNWIRTEILPRLDDGFGPEARRALARLARLSAVDAEAWESVLLPIEAELFQPGGDGEFSFEVGTFLGVHMGVQARLVRRIAGRLGVSLDEGQTKSVLRFVSTGTSGSVFSPRAGLEVRREFEGVVFSAPPETSEYRELEIRDSTAGSGSVSLGQRRFTVNWFEGLAEPAPGGAWVERFSSELLYPARVRAWRPGDRVSFDFGSKKLKKVFGEARVPARARASVPVLVDFEDRVLWVPGLARSRLARSPGGERAITISVQEEHS